MAFRAALVHLVARALRRCWLHGLEDPPQHPRLTPPKRRLRSRTANPTPHSGQLASWPVLPCVPITFGDGVPVLVSQERVGAVSQAVGAAAKRLVALHALAPEMHRSRSRGAMSK